MQFRRCISRPVGGRQALTVCRNFHPVALIGLLLVKKAAAFAAIKVYGLPRLYRRLLEQNKALVPVDLQRQTRDAIRSCFDFYPAIYSTVRDNEQLQKILRETSRAGAGAVGSMPSAVADLSKIILDFVVPKKE